MSKRKQDERSESEESEESEEEEENQHEAKVPRTVRERDNGKRVIVILEQATLETVKTSKGFELLNCDDHRCVLLGRDNQILVCISCARSHCL